MTLFYKSFPVLVWTRLVLSTLPGLSYMDLMRPKTLDNKLLREDHCNPLYWYPNTIPQYCYFKPLVINTITEKLPLPVPLPVSVKLPIPVPPPSLMAVLKHLPRLRMPLSIMPPLRSIVPPPAPPTAIPPLFAQSSRVPIAPADPLKTYGTNLQSHFPFPYPLTGFVPPLKRLVTEDGGVNIMPFSEAYADVLEGHKNKMIHKKHQRILIKYEHFPKSRKYLRLT